MDTQELRLTDITRWLRVMLHWLWLIALAAVTAAGLAYTLSSRVQPVYEATATLLITEGQKATGSDYNAILTSERLARTYAELLKGQPVLGAARDALGLMDSLDGAVTVELVRDTQLIRLHARHTNPFVAADIANTVARVFREQNEARQKARLTSSSEGLLQEMQSLQAKILGMQGELNRLGTQETTNDSRAAHLQYLVAQYQAAYAGLLQSYEQTRVASAAGADSITVAEAATVPAVPVLPKTTSNTILAAFGGVLLAGTVVALVEYLDDTVKTADDVEAATRLGVLATILRYPHRAGAGKLPLMAADPGSFYAEAYRMLRTNIQFASLPVKGRGRLLLVTSPQPSEGKTTTLVNLGICLAQSGKKVLLVDMDLRCAAVHKLFGLGCEAGIVTLLHKSGLCVEDVAQQTEIPGLQVLTAGPMPANPAEVLGSPETAALLERLREQADYVLLDSPPVLSVTDASILAQMVDGVLLVAQAGRTRTGALLQTVATLMTLKGHVLGVVLNSVVSSRHGNVHYYAHYHGERYGSTDRPTLSATPEPR
ncbi:MAG: polysaccharide biosynthesis tyrosine autokinase [Anaerolineae bacterium]